MKSGCERSGVPAGLLFCRSFPSVDPGGPFDGFDEVLTAKGGFKRADIVAKFGVEKAAVIEGVGPGDRVIFAHGFASPGFEVVPDGFESGFIDPKKDIESGLSSNGFGVIGPVGRVEEGLAVPCDCRVIFGGGVYQDPGFEIL